MKEVPFLLLIFDESFTFMKGNSESPMRKTASICFFRIVDSQIWFLSQSSMNQIFMVKIFWRVETIPDSDIWSNFIQDDRQTVFFFSFEPPVECDVLWWGQQGSKKWGEIHLIKYKNASENLFFSCLWILWVS